MNDARSSLVGYSTELPEKCPPVEATDREHCGVLRFVNPAGVTTDCFKSHKELNKPKPKEIDSCVWASCSLFRDKDSQGYAKARKLPALRAKAVAVLNIPVGSGLATTCSANGHIDMWFFNGVDPASFVVGVL